MNKFDKLFGVRAGQVRKNCVLLPCVNKDMLAGFGVKSLGRGKLYGCSNLGNFSLIHTGMSAGLVGDAVLYLKETPCENVVLFGSCGSLGKLDIGSLVMPVKCVAQESFTEMLKGAQEPRVFYPDNDLTEAFLQQYPDAGIKKATCLTVSSLKLEEERAQAFQDQGIDVVDMECSAFFSSARHVGLKAMSLFYVSDVVLEKPFYLPLSVQDKKTRDASMKSAVSMLCDFLKKN